jgi:hypothetical protein
VSAYSFLKQVLIITQALYQKTGKINIFRKASATGHNIEALSDLCWQVQGLSNKLCSKKGQATCSDVVHVCRFGTLGVCWAWCLTGEISILSPCLEKRLIPLSSVR